MLVLFLEDTGDGWQALTGHDGLQECNARLSFL